MDDYNSRNYSDTTQAILCDPMPEIEKVYFNNCKVANFLVQDDIATGRFPVDILTLPNAGICVWLNVEFDKELERSKRNITPYDMVVMDAVCTFYECNVGYFTLEMIVRMMDGSMDADVTKQKKAAVRESIYKLSHIKIRIVFKDEYERRKEKDKNIKKIDFAEASGYLLSLKEVQVIPHFHKNSTEGFWLVDVPPLYFYAKVSKQIFSVPTELLNIAGMSMTMETIVIRNYLYKRIANMRHHNNHMDSNRIVYDRRGGTKGMMPALGYGQEYQKKHGNYYAKKKMVVHRKVLRILDWFQEKGFILGYELVHRGTGGQIYGVDILCEPLKEEKMIIKNARGKRLIL